MLAAIVAIITFMLLVFLLAQFLKNNSIVDIAWGIGFIIVALITYIQNPTITSLIIFLLVTAWGSRLSFHILCRNWKKDEDWRYQKWRENFGKHPAINAFFRIFLVQTILMLLISLPLLYPSTLSWSSLLGTPLWITGFYWQIRADNELENFKKTGLKGILKRGLWARSRHPNYFGEVLMWIGIWLLSGTFWTIISPITITVVLWYISIPLMEERQQEKEGWNEYVKETPKLFPL